MENGDASSTASTVNDSKESVDHCSDIVTVPISEAPDTRLPPSSPVTSVRPEVANGSVGVASGGVAKPDLPPVLIHVDGKKPKALPNGFVHSESKVFANSVASKEHRPSTLGE